MRRKIGLWLRTLHAVYRLLDRLRARVLRAMIRAAKLNTGA